MPSKLKSIVECLFNGKTNFCTICFSGINSSSKGTLSITDKFVFQSKIELNLLQILNALYPENVNNYITGSVCHKCGKQALSSYLFLKKFKDNIEYLSNVTINLKNNLKHSLDENLECLKTLYLLRDRESVTFQSLYDTKCDIKSVLGASLRIKYILEDEIEENISIELTPIQEFESEHTNKNSTSNNSTVDAMCEMDGESKIKCKVCLKLYPTKSNFRQHYVRVHGPKTIKCPKCPKHFGSSAILQQHQTESHLDAICSKCGKTFNNRHYLKMHELSHKVNFKCEICNRIYKRQDSFNRHLILNICGQMQRKSHLDGKFTCDICKKRFCSKVSLGNHIKVQHGFGIAHTCSWCNKRFGAKSSLNAHTVKHTQVKKYSCGICSEKFVTKESLTYHTRRHTGEKPYKCFECDAAFISSSYRSVHVNSCHRHLKCSVCNSKFKSKLGLQKHKNANKCKEC